MTPSVMRSPMHVSRLKVSASPVPSTPGRALSLVGLMLALVLVPACSGPAPAVNPPGAQDASGSQDLRPGTNVPRAQQGPQRETAVTTPEPTPHDPADPARFAQDPRTGPLRSPSAVPVLPYIRIDRESRAVEIDATVPVNLADPETPIIWLEVVLCTPDTREYESLLVTRARAAHAHAALLMLGLEPGSPGQVRWSGERWTLVEPRGPELRVVFRWMDAHGILRQATPEEWIIGRRGARFPGPGATPRGWVFAGSEVRPMQGWDGRTRPTYMADAAGTLIGLATFSSETIAWRGVISPDSGVHPEEWIADQATVPPVGTAVVVVITPTDARSPSTSP